VTNSRTQACADEIKAAQIEVERAMRAHSRGGSLDEVNRANSRLGTAHNRLYEINGGVVRDDR
jgi:hypothetical protein